MDRVFTNPVQDSPGFLHGEEWAYLIWGSCTGVPLAYSSFRFSRLSVRIGSCRLRHSCSQERDSSPTGTFPTERTGSRRERRAWVKRSRSIITLLFRQV